MKYFKNEALYEIWRWKYLQENLLLLRKDKENLWLIIRGKDQVIATLNVYCLFQPMEETKKLENITTNQNFIDGNHKAILQWRTDTVLLCQSIPWARKILVITCIHSPAYMHSRVSQLGLTGVGTFWTKWTKTTWK